MAQWQHEHTVTSGAANGQIVYRKGYRDKLGGPTHNAMTPSALPFMTMSLLLGIRLMPEDPGERLALPERVMVYPYAERDNPRPRGYLPRDGSDWLSSRKLGVDGRKPAVQAAREHNLL